MKKIAGNVMLVIASLAVPLILAEVLLSLVETPSDRSSGMLFGQELPPLLIVPRAHILSDSKRRQRAESWYKPLIVDGQKITYGDLEGLMREDRLLGHAPLAKAVSTNRWWQSNNLGARARKDVTKSRVSGKRRILLFGDSYTQGSRVRQEQTFAYVLDQMLPRVDVINFGVEGYGMGQAFLRYQQENPQIDHDLVFLILVPDVDLWRDINVSRFVGRRWEAYKLNPRFIIQNGQLQLIPAPYASLDEMLADNRYGASNKMITHLRRYDRFYFPSMFERNPILDHSILFRLAKLVCWKYQHLRLSRELYDPAKEAVQVTVAIANEMSNLAQRSKAQFTLIILPASGDTDRYLREPSYRERWDKMAGSLCKSLHQCLDLMPDLTEVSADRLDLGYDGTHFGPSANHLIAEILFARALSGFPDSADASSRESPRH